MTLYWSLSGVCRVSLVFYDGCLCQLADISPKLAGGPGPPAAIFDRVVEYTVFEMIWELSTSANDLSGSYDDPQLTVMSDGLMRRGQASRAGIDQ